MAHGAQALRRERTDVIYSETHFIDRKQAPEGCNLQNEKFYSTPVCWLIPLEVLSQRRRARAVPFAVTKTSSPNNPPNAL